MLGPGDRPCRRGGANLTTCTVEGDLVILDRMRGYVHQLNATATHIWSACDGRHSVDEIAASLRGRFGDAPHDLHDTVVKTVSDFERLGLLVPSLPDATALEETS
jgi:hypothetical protein